jgi:hypothetical protein
MVLELVVAVAILIEIQTVANVDEIVKVAAECDGAMALLAAR